MEQPLYGSLVQSSDPAISESLFSEETISSFSNEAALKCPVPSFSFLRRLVAEQSSFLLSFLIGVYLRSNTDLRIGSFVVSSWFLGSALPSHLVWRLVCSLLVTNSNTCLFFHRTPLACPVG